MTEEETRIADWRETKRQYLADLDGLCERIAALQAEVSQPHGCRDYDRKLRTLEMYYAQRLEMSRAVIRMQEIIDSTPPKRYYHNSRPYGDLR